MSAHKSKTQILEKGEIDFEDYYPVVKKSTPAPIILDEDEYPDQ